ncbi:MAG: hypothetical protein ACLFSQ_07465 [Candidatus Zixiibacteriota bacterium]
MKKIFLVLFFSVLLLGDSGGPDDFGYSWVDSREDFGPDFNWIEIKETGERLSRVSDSDNGEEYVEFERPFEYYGEMHEGITVSSNGAAAFGRWTYIPYYVSSFPSYSDPDAALGIFWTYLSPYSSLADDNGIYYQDFGEYIVIEWCNIVEKYNTGNVFTFQIVIDYARKAIYYNYLSLDGLGSHTAYIGIENLDGSDGLFCGTNTSSGSNFAEDSLTVRFRGEPTASPPYFNDFSRGDDLQMPDAPTGWEWGEPEFGPDAAYSGDYCFGTDLDDNYGTSINWTILGPNLELTYAETAVLDFYAWYSTEDEVDGGFCEVSTDDGYTWSQVHPEGGYPGRTGSSSPVAGMDAFIGESDGWEYFSFDLSDYCGQEIKFRFYFFSNGSYGAPGLYIDDLGLHQKFGYLRGTVDLAYSSVDAGAIVTLAGTGRKDTTDMDGFFAFDSVFTDTTYTIHFEKPSYLPDSITDVEIIRLDTVEIFKILAPELYFNDFATSNGGWRAIPDSIGWQWGKPNPIASPSQAYSDSFCWGTNLEGFYHDNANWILEQTIFISEIDFPAIRFWQWYSFAGDFMGELFDGGNLKISTDGGETFEILHPDRRYDITYDGLIAEYNDYLYGEPAFGGQTNGNYWHPVTFDMSEYSDEVSIYLRFEIASDAMGRASGWYIDNMQIFDNWEAVHDEPLGTLPYSLDVTASPNPFNGACRISYSVPYDTRLLGDMQIYSADGRLIDRIPVIDKPGTYSAKWQPRNASGGIYLIVLPTDKGIIQEKIVYIK